VEHALEGEAADIRGADVINSTTTMTRVGNRQTERAVMLSVVLAPWIILVMQVETVIGRGVDYPGSDDVIKLTERNTAILKVLEKQNQVSGAMMVT